MWTILVLSTSVILFAQADRNTGLYHQQQSILKRGPPNAEQDTGAKAKAIKLKREEHLVGDLPWAEGQEPITSYAGHFPIRNWHQSGYRGETGMYVFICLYRVFVGLECEREVRGFSFLILVKIALLLALTNNNNMFVLWFARVNLVLGSTGISLRLNLKFPTHHFSCKSLLSL